MDGAKIEREVELPVGADELWDALTDPAELADWFGEDPGMVTSTVPPRRLVYERRDDDGLGRRIEFTVTPTPDGSHLKVVERRLEDWRAPIGFRQRALATVG